MQAQEEEDKFKPDPPHAAMPSKIPSKESRKSDKTHTLVGVYND